jgi:hypothetical protein
MSIGIMAGIAAKSIAKEFKLDFSHDSLEVVDCILDCVKDWRSSKLLVMSLGCYVGEILIRETGGRWCAEENYAGPLWTTWVEVPSKSGTIKADPFVRCRKRIKNGKASGIALWVKDIIAMANNPAIMAEAV